MKEGALRKGMALEAEYGKEMDSSLESQEAIQPCQLVDFIPVRAISDLKEKFVCFKQLSL